MKRVIIIVSLIVAGAFISHAQEERCDTLKWKVIKTFYGTGTDNGYFSHIIGGLDGVTINIDTFSNLFHAMNVVNISNDTFVAGSRVTFYLRLGFCADTGVIGNWSMAVHYNLEENCFPNDTFGLITIYYPLPMMINDIKEQFNIDLEQISYWQMMTGVIKTDKDGQYSPRAHYASEDTAIFYIVRGGTGVQEIEKNQPIVSVYPNPAKTHFTVTNTENAEIQLFNILGQKVFQTFGTQENTVVNTASLPQGLYILKVEKDNVSTVHKVQIVR